MQRELGVREALPDWVTYLRAADRLHCAPWELEPEGPPRRYWMEATLTLGQAEAEARRRAPKR